MYHYIRPIEGSKFPKIKGLELEGFKRQLDYFEENFNIVTSDEVINAVLKKKLLPQNACWLTFDDGFKDHIKYVMPELLNRNLSGAFFPASSPITKFKILNVHSIQHILCCSENIENLVIDLNLLCKLHGFTQNQINSLYKKYAVPSRYDTAETMYVKRMLQFGLKEKIQNYIISNLFEKYVKIKKSEFLKKIYMNMEDVLELVKNGMYVGSHGAEHYWYNEISENKQREDIKTSLEFLEKIGTPTSNWIMCYPYGGYNKTTLSIIKKYGASLGLTTNIGEALIGESNPLTLPRLDTNDFPQ